MKKKLLTGSKKAGKFLTSLQRQVIVASGLRLSGTFWTPTADRATFSSSCLGLFARPLMSCTHSMCSFSTLAGNLALFFRTHRGKSAPTTLTCLHVSTLFLLALFVKNFFGLGDTWARFLAIFLTASFPLFHFDGQRERYSLVNANRRNPCKTMYPSST